MNPRVSTFYSSLLHLTRICSVTSSFEIQYNQTTMSMDPYNEQRLRDEVIYLHSLWHQGPPRLNPYPNPNHTTSTHLLPPSNPPQFKKPNKRPKRANKTPPQSDLEWPCKENPVDPSPSGWPARTLITRVVLSPEEQAQFAATRIQNKAVTALEGFFAGNLDTDGEGSDEDDEMGGDGYEEYQFFLKLFEEEELRGYCEKNWEGGDFVCLVCSGIGKRKRFKNCVAVVQHSVAIARTKKKKAHRAYAQVLCRVLGWDIDRLPTIDSSLAKPIESQGNAEVAIGESGMINKDSNLENVDSEEIIQKEVPDVDKEEELLSSSVPGTSTVIGDNVMPCENSLKDGDANKCVENIGNGVQSFGHGNTGVTTCLNSLKDGDANKCVENIDNGVQSFGDGSTGVATCLESVKTFVLGIGYEKMSGSQGALPPGVITATTYESVEGSENKPKLDIRSREDEGGVEIDKVQDKVPGDLAGPGPPLVFVPDRRSGGEVEDEKEKKDLGGTGTAAT